MLFVSNDSISSEQLKPFTEVFKSVYNKDIILKSENLFWENYDSNKKRLVTIMEILEINECYNTSFYKNTLDTLIKIEPISTNYFNLPPYHKKKW